MAMAEENISQVKEMITDKNCCFDDAKPMKIIEETMPLMDEEIAGDGDVLDPPPAALSNGVIIPETSHVKSRRCSTGGLDKRAPAKAQAQAQTRYRGNQMGSTHDLCKHGKRREDDLVIKPWKLVKKKNVEGGGDLGKVETLSVTRKSLLGNVAKSKAASEIVKSCDGLRVKRSETKSTTIPSDSPVETKRESDSEVVKSGDGLPVKRNETKSTTTPREVKKTNLGVTKIPRISPNKSSKEDLLKNLKNKEKKEKIDEPVDVVEKTLYVVESSIEEEEKKVKKKSTTTVKSEIQQSSDKKILRSSVKKSPSLLPSLSPSSKVVKESRLTKSDPRPIRQTTTTTTRSKTGLSSEKKEVGSSNLVTNPKTESKIKPKRTGVKVTPPAPLTRQVSFKKGKLLEPKIEDSASTSVKYKKRVVQEPKLRYDVNKKKKILKDKRAINTINGEGKREKVILRHRKVEAKKKLQTFNNVIEETVNKLEEVRKSKVKALVGAFETVISLQDDKTKISQKKKKIQSKSTSSQVVEGG